jgi:hypothetical protein
MSCVADNPENERVENSDEIATTLCVYCCGEPRGKTCSAKNLRRKTQDFEWLTCGGDFTKSLVKGEGRVLTRFLDFDDHILSRLCKPRRVYLQNHVIPWHLPQFYTLR